MSDPIISSFFANGDQGDENLSIPVNWPDNYSDAETATISSDVDFPYCDSNYSFYESDEEELIIPTPFCSSGVMLYKGSADFLDLAHPLSRGTYYIYQVDSSGSYWNGQRVIFTLPTINTTSVFFERRQSIQDAIWHQRASSKYGIITDDSIILLHYKLNNQLTLTINGFYVGIIGVVPGAFTIVYPYLESMKDSVWLSVHLRPIVVSPCDNDMTLCTIMEASEEFDEE